MKAIGFDNPLCILLFDQRTSQQTKMFGWTGALAAVLTDKGVGAAVEALRDGIVQVTH